MIEHNHDHEKEHLATGDETEAPPRETDHASESLSEALRISFVALKIIMFILIVVFLASGFTTVSPVERALVLQFGQIRGVGEERMLGPGLHWVFPYPIEEIVKIPVEKKVNLAVDNFWYYQNPSELLPDSPAPRRISRTLDPIADGYCLTSGGQSSPQDTSYGGSDYGIVHCKWQVIYNIDDPGKFFRNVYVVDIRPGDVYFDVITASIKPLLSSLIADAVVSTMVNYNIDQALFLNQGSITQDVKQLVQQKLDVIESGIKVDTIQLTDIVWPRQVDVAFQASIRASQASQQAIDEAKGYAENTLNEAAGPVAPELIAVINKENELSQEQENFLWSRVAGQAQEKLAQARAYRTEVVENAKANAEYLNSILPEYQKRPELFIQGLYRDAMETVLSNAEEKIVIQPVKDGKGSDIWIMLNRDPSIKKEQTDQ
ncbi:MAG: protease modulator HflK [Planctomycetota bacterium]|jgi:regulator of protease activity HflC (stomatin/prohibitin superfamily)